MVSFYREFGENYKSAVLGYIDSLLSIYFIWGLYENPDQCIMGIYNCADTAVRSKLNRF